MPKPTFAEQLQAIAALREPIRRRLYQFVERQTVAVSRDEAAEAVGTRRAMAAFHLDKLVELGLLRAAYRRLSGRTGRGAGRPSKLYRRSRRQFAVTLPARNYELLARLLVEKAAASADGDAATHSVVHRYGRSLGARARKRVSSRTTPQRLGRCVTDVLEELGFEPVQAKAGEAIWARNCPFDPLSRQYTRIVCNNAIEFVGGIIDGVGGTSLKARRDDRSDRCCVLVERRSPKTATRLR
jgi:predicted ArsR family transcriptional regulator